MNYAIICLESRGAGIEDIANCPVTAFEIDLLRMGDKVDNLRTLRKDKK